jgi:hypothetical protein
MLTCILGWIIGFGGSTPAFPPSPITLGPIDQGDLTNQTGPPWSLTLWGARCGGPWTPPLAQDAVAPQALEHTAPSPMRSSFNHVVNEPKNRMNGDNNKY